MKISFSTSWIFVTLTSLSSYSSVHADVSASVTTCTTKTIRSSDIASNLTSSKGIVLSDRNAIIGRNVNVDDDADMESTGYKEVKYDPMVLSSLRAGSDISSSIVTELFSKEKLGVSFFVVVDHLLRQVFRKSGITFPSQLAGCLILFALMVIAPTIGDQVFHWLTPGAAWLAKWLPVMFVPGLVMVPIAPSVGSSVELIKIAAIICGGFLFTLLSTAYSVMFVRSVQGTLVSERPASTTSASLAGAPASKPFSEELKNSLVTLALVSGCLALAPISAIQESGFVTPLTNVSYLSGTLAGFVWGARLPASVTKMVHPLVTSAIVALIQAQVMGIVSGRDLKTMVKIYKSGSFAWNAVGAGDLLLYALGPAVFSLAIAMYSRKNLMAENLAVVLTGALVSSAGGIFSTAFAARLLNVARPLVRLSVISRNVTTPLAIAITNMLNGDVPIACVVVVLTGIFGVSVWAPVLNYFKVADPLARGLAVGAAAQGVGVASIAGEKDAFPFAAINMVMTAVFATILISIPSVRDLVIQILSSN